MAYYPYYSSGSCIQGSLPPPPSYPMMNYYPYPMPVPVQYAPPYYPFPWHPYQSHASHDPYASYGFETAVDEGENRWELWQPMWDSPESPQSPWVRAYREEMEEKER